MNHECSTPRCTIKNQKAANYCCLKMDPVMDISEIWVPLKGVAKILEAGLQSKTWDIHGMPHFITTTYHEGCNTCEAYALHVVEASKVPMVEILPREVKKGFWTAWLNIVCHIEDEASSESNRKVEWYSNCHDKRLQSYQWLSAKTSRGVSSLTSSLSVKTTTLSCYRHFAERDRSLQRLQDRGIVIWYSLLIYMLVQIPLPTMLSLRIYL